MGHIVLLIDLSCKLFQPCYPSRMIIDALNCSNWDESLFIEARDGGVTCAHVTLAVWETARETLSQVDKWNRHFQNYSDSVSYTHLTLPTILLV